MTYVNFKLDTDADGIALVTWDAPGRSMNVIDMKVMEELADIVEKVAGDAADQGRGDHLRQGHVLRRRRPHDAGNARPRIRRLARDAGRGEAAMRALRGEPQALAALPAAGDLAASRGWRRSTALTLGGGFELCLACHHRVACRQSEIARGPARDQDRAVPRCRRHAAHRAHDAARRRAAVSAQGRPDQARAGQGHEDRRRGRAGGRTGRGREKMDQGRRQGARTRGMSKVSGCPAGPSIPRPG